MLSSQPHCNCKTYASINNDYLLFMKSTYCLKSMEKYPMKCGIYHYVIDWAKVFRIKVVFAVSKVIVYFLASDFGGSIPTPRL